MENTVIDKLKEFGIEIYKIYEDKDDEVLITADKLTISCKGNEVFLNFHVSAKASYAARIMLILMDIKKIKFYVGEDFLFDENGKFMDGEEAISYHKEFQRKMTINEFMDQQQKLFYLTKAKSYHC